MSSGNSSSRYADEATGETRTIGSDDEQGTFATVVRYARRIATSGVLAGLAGGVYALRGLRSLRRGEWGTAALRLFIGGLLLAVARDQRATDSRSGEAEDVSLEDQMGLSASEESDPASEIGAESEADRGGETDAETGGETESEPRTKIEGQTGATSDIGAEAQTGRDADDETGDADASGAETGGENASDTETEDASSDVSETPPESATYERLGEAAFDEHSNEVPAPQRAFNQEYLALGSEAVWGIREEDDVVVVTQNYDAIQDQDGFRYVASSQVDDDQMVTVPDTVLNHWDDVADGGTAVVGGDDLVFATTDRLKADDLLVVIIEEWGDELNWGE